MTQPQQPSGGGRMGMHMSNLHVSNLRMSNLIKAATWTSARVDAVRYGAVACLLGIVFIGVTGFAPLPAIHDAAHNTRHAVSFPCH